MTHVYLDGHMEKAHAGDAGYDLYYDGDDDVTVYPGTVIMVPTGVKRLSMDDTMMALVVSRSGLTYRHGVIVANAPGVIDSGYRGPVNCLMTNVTTTPYTITPGERIAQLLFVKVETPHITISGDDNDFADSDSRGEHGFGSSGKH